MRVEVFTHDGADLGAIWSEGDSVIKSDPPQLIDLIVRPLREGGVDLDAPGAVAMLNGFSNGYLVVRAV